MNVVEKQELTTESVLQSMFTENTGSHFLDSGGAYGRWHEDNQGIDFDNQPDVRIDVTWCRYTESVTLDVFPSAYKACLSVFEYAAEMDKRFQGSDEYNDPDISWFGRAMAFAESVHDGDCRDIVDWNTYDVEALYSMQTLQGVQFGYGDTQYVALQVHGGCDVRGGYTVPRIFECPGDITDYPIYDLTDFVVAALEVDGTDNAWHFNAYEGTWEFYGNYCPVETDKTLHDFPASRDIADIGKGITVFTEDGKLYCPIKGKQILYREDAS